MDVTKTDGSAEKTNPDTIADVDCTSATFLFNLLCPDNIVDVDIEQQPPLTEASQPTKSPSTNLIGGTKRRNAVASGIVIVLLTVGIALVVIYGRPTSWKETVEYEGVGAFGGLLEFSEDGSILAVGNTNFHSEWGVQVFEANSNQQLGQFLPFLDLDDLILAKNSWGQYSFDPSYVTDNDLSLSGDGHTLVLSSVVALSDHNYSNVRNLCGQSIGSDCHFGRVTVYHYEDSEWINKDGPLYEYLLPDSDLAKSLRVALSGDKSTLAICQSSRKVWVDGYATGAVISVFGLDEDGNYRRGIGKNIYIDNVGNAHASISINNDGTRLAIGGFDEARVYDLVKGEWKRISNPTGFDGLETVSVSMSKSGTRMAVSYAAFTNWYDGSNYNGNLMVYQWSDVGEWLQIGNSISERVYPGSATGQGLVMCGDGTTIAHGGYDFGGKRRVRIYRLNSNDEWVQIGGNIVGTPNSRGVALSCNGNRVATGPLGNTKDGKSVVSIYEFRRWRLSLSV